MRWIAASILPMLAGCGGDKAELAGSKAPLPPPAPLVDVKLTDFRFIYRAKIPDGRVIFRFKNVGRATHVPSLLPLDEDFPPILEQLRGQERRTAAPLGGLRNRFPDQLGSFAVDLVAGQRYALICFAVDPDGSAHRLKGMADEFRPSRNGADWSIQK